jgi:hypothetical protein
MTKHGDISSIRLLIFFFLLNSDIFFGLKIAMRIFVHSIYRKETQIPAPSAGVDKVHERDTDA